jgi:hypothetical protein
MVHLVPGSGLECCEILRRQTSPKGMRPERPCGNGEQGRQGAQAEEQPFHSVHRLDRPRAASSSALARRSAHPAKIPIARMKTMSLTATTVMLGGGGPYTLAT